MITLTRSRSDLKTVPVTMPMAIWVKLARIADREGYKVWHLVGRAIERVIAADGVDDIDEAYRRVLDAIARGWDDRSVAEQLGLPVSVITAWREDKGMKACPLGHGEGPI